MNLLRSIIVAALVAASQASASPLHEGPQVQIDFTEPELHDSIDEKIDTHKHREHEVELRDDHVNAVPLPTAGWLFGSALIGFVVIARRRF